MLSCKRCQFHLNMPRKKECSSSELMLTMVKHVFTASSCYISVVTHAPASLSLAKTWRTLEQQSKLNLNKCPHESCNTHPSIVYPNSHGRPYMQKSVIGVVVEGTCGSCGCFNEGASNLGPASQVT